MQLAMSAKDIITITVASEDICDNLDLEAVTSIFGASKDLEDFEKRLNDPETQISNLDLNNDGEVDFSRPATKPASRPKSKPSAQHTTRPTSKPINRSSYIRPSGGASRSSSRQAPSRSSVRRTRY